MARGARARQRGGARGGRSRGDARPAARPQARDQIRSQIIRSDQIIFYPTIFYQIRSGQIRSYDACSPFRSASAHSHLLTPSHTFSHLLTPSLGLSALACAEGTCWRQAYTSLGIRHFLDTSSSLPTHMAAGVHVARHPTLPRHFLVTFYTLPRHFLLTSSSLPMAAGVHVARHHAALARRGDLPAAARGGHLLLVSFASTQ